MDYLGNYRWSREAKKLTIGNSIYNNNVKYDETEMALSIPEKDCLELKKLTIEYQVLNL